MLRHLKKALGFANQPASPAQTSAPLSAEVRFAQAMTLLQARRLEEALLAFDTVLDLDPKAAAAHFNRGGVLSDLGRTQEALDAFSRCSSLVPRFVDAHVSRGVALAKLGNAADARAAIDRALAIEPNSFDALEASADLLREQPKPIEAAALYERLLEREPRNERLLNSYGIALQDLDRPEEALDAYAKALQIKPAFPEALTNKGTALMALGRYQEALSSYSKALRVDPNFATAHMNEGTCRLSLGDLRKGWQGYEWRWRSSSWTTTQGFYSRRRFERPLWLRGSSLKGKTIFVHPEQGLGDTIQFVRYATVLASRGATVLLEVQAPLRQTLREIDGLSGITTAGEPVPPHDVHCPLMSLPLACGTTLDNIPAADGYLGNSAEHRERAERWRIKLGPRSKPRVGLVWSGSRSHKNDANRSIPWAEFSRIVSDRQEFICLQNELRDGDRELLEHYPAMRLFLEDLTDFSETAALIANLDLVVCVDTSVAHLAGATGKPVWVLLPANPDWRWMLERRDSPWYASMQLFRQTSLGDWNQPLDEVRRELESLSPAAASTQSSPSCT